MWNTIWKIVKWILFVAFPVVAAFIIYVILNGKDFDSMENGSFIKMIPAAAEEFLSRYPFVEIVAKFFEKAVTGKEMTVQTLTDGVLKGLLTYTTVDLLKRHYEIKKGAAGAARFIAIHGTWVVLISYVAGLLVDSGFDRLEEWLSDALQLQVTKLLILLVIFAAAVGRFCYTTKKSIPFSILWVFMEKVFFALLSSILLTSFSWMAHKIIFGGGSSVKAEGIYDVMPLFIFYILLAAVIDFLKGRSRYWVTSHC